MGLALLKELTTDFEIREYLKVPPTPAEIAEIALKSNQPLANWVRTQEDYFRTYLKGKQFSQEEWIKIICENPKLLKRPIVVGRYKAVLGNSLEAIRSIL